jgi:hypothetical protein
MGFLGNIFKPKAGGTKVGNLLRGVTNSVSGGTIGTGTDLIKYEVENGYRDPITGQATSKYNNEVYGMSQPTSTSPLAKLVSDKALAGALGTNEGKEMTQDVVVGILQKYWLYIVAAIVAIIGLVLIVKNQSKSKGGRKKVKY